MFAVFFTAFCNDKSLFLSKDLISLVNMYGNVLYYCIALFMRLKTFNDLKIIIQVRKNMSVIQRNGQKYQEDVYLVDIQN